MSLPGTATERSANAMADEPERRIWANQSLMGRDAAIAQIIQFGTL